MKKLTLILITACLVSCAGPVSYTGQAPLAEGEAVKDWQKIEVISLTQIRKDYEIIGECRVDPAFDNVIGLKKQAARLNADAISKPERSSGGLLIAQAIKYKSK